MKNRKLSILIISVLVALLLLLALAFVLKNGKQQTGSKDPNVQATEQSVTIENEKDGESGGKEAGFHKTGSEKQDKSNADVKGGSETIGIIKTEEDADSGENDTTDEETDTRLPGIW